MVFGEVEGREYMPVIFDLRSFGNREAKACEYGADLLLNDSQRMA